MTTRDTIYCTRYQVLLFLLRMELKLNFSNFHKLIFAISEFLNFPLDVFGNEHLWLKRKSYRKHNTNQSQQLSNGNFLPKPNKKRWGLQKTLQNFTFPQRTHIIRAIKLWKRNSMYKRHSSIKVCKKKKSLHGQLRSKFMK